MNYSRRKFLETGLATLAGIAPFSILNGQEVQRDTSRAFPLTIAGYPYERVKAIQDGRAQVAGCKVKFETSRIGELNQHIFSGPGTRDVTEVGLIPYLLAYSNDDFRDYQLLPIFVLKLFRHKSIFIRTDRGIKKPEDLRGRKVATVGYSSSGLTWIRGILQDEYGVKPEEIQWVMTAKDSASKQTGGASKWEKVLPAGLSMTQAPPGKNESDLLIEGTVDAIFHPAEPKVYVDGHPKVDRLFPDSRKVESEYFKKTGIFPIMHIVAMRRKLIKAEPWLPKAVFDAYMQAKQIDYAEMKKILWAYSSLPWFGQELKETQALMGQDYYSYGIKNNRKALNAVFRYIHEQGLVKRKLTIDEMFPKEMQNF